MTLDTKISEYKKKLAQETNKSDDLENLVFSLKEELTQLVKKTDSNKKTLASLKAEKDKEAERD